MRAPNSIDFWRGYALITIFITHVPGIIFERYTLREYSLSDSAELFVFLAGLSLRFVVDSLSKQPLAAAVYRLAGRALTIYYAQLIISFLALAILAGAATAARAALYPAMAQCGGGLRQSGARPISAWWRCATSSAISTSCRSMWC